MIELTDEMMGDTSDEALETELAALLSDSSTTCTRVSKSTVSGERGMARASVSSAPAVTAAALDLSCLQDEQAETDDDVDENDPQLLAELMSLSTGGEYESGSETQSAAPPGGGGRNSPVGDLTSLLQHRQHMYQLAHSSASQANDTSRARRYARGLKTIDQLLARVHTGGAVCEQDIPPAISTPAPSSASLPAVSAPATLTESSKTHTQAGSGSDNSPSTAASALTPPSPRQLTPAHVPAPHCSTVEPEVESGSDGASLSPASCTRVPPDCAPSSSPACHPRLVEVQKRRDQFKQAAIAAKHDNDKQRALQCVQIVKAFDEVLRDMHSGKQVDLSDMPAQPSHFFSITVTATVNDARATHAPVVPSSVSECLQQRLEYYLRGECEARESGNASKARRYARICKQYEQAIKQHTASRYVDLELLPNPPGFPPIEAKQPVSTSKPTTNTTIETTNIIETTNTAATTAPKPAVASVGAGKQSRSEQQRVLLQQKHRQFMQAAREAKRSGNISLAKQHLRQAKRFEPLIQAASHGLPVNMSSLPESPQSKVLLDRLVPAFEVLCSHETTVTGASNNNDEHEGTQMTDPRELFASLKKQLVRQVQFCREKSSECKLLGDIGQANSYEQLAVRCARDLHALQLAFNSSTGDNDSGAFRPRLHYETRQFRVVQACTELADKQLEICIIQGVNYNVAKPSQVDTYVKWDFPWPAEGGTSGRTSTVNDTNNPRYAAKFMVNIDRTSRAMIRVFRRGSVKCDVWQRGRLFGLTDQLIGTAQVKLEDLCNRCRVHNSYEVMEGRRTVKGKLEVRLRVRTPLVHPHVENVDEKWLVIDDA